MAMAAVSTLGLAQLHGGQPGQAPAPSRTVLDGVFTAAQAQRGAAEYNAACAGCHSADLDGAGAAPTLHTETFLDRWREDHLDTLYDYIRVNMPQRAGRGPGGLSEQQYLDITSYILSRNDYPAGAKELTAADLKETQLVGLNGPQPMPANATVRVVGCLAHAGEAWSVTNASAPVRVRKGDATDPAELAASAAVPPGTLSFQLRNLEEDRKVADLEAQVGKRVQVKGVINGQGANARVSVLSFEGLGAACQ